jgi:hypothetical protein
MWTALRVLTNALGDLFTVPLHIKENNIWIIERFIILLYDITSTSTDVDRVRCKLFAKKANDQLICRQVPVLKQHVQRALAPTPVFPSNRLVMD